MKILMISTDQKIFEPESAVKTRMRSYASQVVDELFIVILGITRALKAEENLKYIGMARLRALFWRPSKKFDLVTSQDPFETGIIARRLAKIIGAQLELQIHTDIGSPYFWQESVKNKFRYLIAKFLLSKADRIRVVSQRIKDYLVSNLKINETKIYIKPIFVDVEKIKNAPITVDLHKKYPQFDKIILMASRLTREKNIGLAIEAVSSLIRANRRIGLVIVGSGPEEKRLKLLASSFQFLDNVIFENWASQEILFSYYKTCDLFLVTSLYEGYGMTLVEAQVAGCRIVSTDVGVAREVGAKIVEHNRLILAKEMTKLL
ncbi:MAG: glycosyltransferase [Candidatus Vogelbacteria bacterium]